MSLGPKLSENNIKTTDPWTNAEIYFTALSDCTLKEVSVRSIKTGRRDFILWDENAGEVERVSYMLDSNRAYNLELDWDLESGKQYSIQTDAAVNLEQFDFPDPSLYSIDRDSFDFPYSDGEYLIITETSLGINEFPYFSNLIIEVPPDTCISERLAVRGVIDGSTSQQNDRLDQSIRMFPNPARYFFDIQLPNFGDWEISIRDIHGHLRHSSKFSGHRKRIRCGTWSSGIYYVMVKNGSSQFHLPIVITR